jgi:hypothetical protein
MTRIVIIAAAWILSLLARPTFSQTADWQSGVARIRKAAKLGLQPGTAFVVALRGGNAYLVTSAHVVEGDEAPQVEFVADPEKSYRASVPALEGGEARGLALLVVRNPPSGLRTMGEAPQAPVSGDAVTVAGFPAAVGGFSVRDTTVVSVEGRDLLLELKTDDGFSGGPVVRNGGAVGIVYGYKDHGIALGSISIRTFLAANKVSWDAPGSKDFQSDLVYLANMAKAHRLKELRGESKAPPFWESTFVMAEAQQCSIAKSVAVTPAALYIAVCTGRASPERGPSHHHTPLRIVGG